MKNCNDIMLGLLTCAVRGVGEEAILKESIADDEIKQLYLLAKKHDLTHLVGAALESAPEKARFKPFFQEAVKAMYRCEWLNGEQEKICAALEGLKIPYIPLKGAVIRALYREPWHRTSCDIDILVPPERLDEALAALESELSYVRGKRSRHDVSLTAPNGVHLELHFDIDEEYVDCAELWADAKPSESGGFRYALSAQMLILTHIAHMAKHFVGGGCGVRPFLDLWLMKERLSYSHDELETALKNHGLGEFGRAVFGLVDVWFDGKKADKTELLMSEYILPAGVYGDLENKISVKRAGGRSKFVFAMERLFPPRSSLKIAYPVLEKQPWLLPVCWPRRWVQLIRAGKLKQVKTEYNINRRLNTQEVNNTVHLLKLLELKK